MPISGTVEISPAGALNKLGENFALYQRASGKTSAAVLVQKGAQFVYGNQDSRFGAVFPGVYGLFAAAAPRPTEITAAAKSRGWRLGRSDSGSIAGISQTAQSRAEAQMGGYASILAQVTETDGRIELTGVRVGKKGKRISGGRRGLGGFAVPGDSPLKAPGDVRLNLRAVETIEEINLREAGRRFLAVSWLFNQYRKLAQSDPLRTQTGDFRRLQNVNPRSKLGVLGELELSGSDNDQTLRITSFVPGVLPVGNSRGIFSQVIQSINDDIGVYLARVHTQQLQGLIKKAMAA